MRGIYLTLYLLALRFIFSYLCIYDLFIYIINNNTKKTHTRSVVLLENHYFTTRRLWIRIQYLYLLIRRPSNETNKTKQLSVCDVLEGDRRWTYICRLCDKRKTNDSVWWIETHLQSQQIPKSSYSNLLGRRQSQQAVSLIKIRNNILRYVYVYAYAYVLHILTELLHLFNDVEYDKI